LPPPLPPPPLPVPLLPPPPLPVPLLPAALPDLKAAPAQWFAHFDRTRTGSLDAHELCSGLNAAAGGVDALDPATVAMLMEACGLAGGQCSLDDFTRPGGVAEMLVASLGL
jgi:hypothetical protein